MQEPPRARAALPVAGERQSLEVGAERQAADLASAAVPEPAAEPFLEAVVEVVAVWEAVVNPALEPVGLEPVLQQVV